MSGTDAADGPPPFEDAFASDDVEQRIYGTILQIREPTTASAITSLVTAADWSSTRSRRSPGSGSNWGRLEGPLQLCVRCSPGGLATYWTRELEEHLVATPAE